MAKSSVTSTTSSPNRSLQFGRSLFVLLFRLVLLAVGGGVGAIVGIAIACFYPALLREPPLVEKLWQRSRQTLGQTPQLSQSWPTVPTTPSSPALNLSPAQQQKLQTDLLQLQTELRTLSDRTATLEAQVGGQPSTEPIESRLQRLSQQLTSSSSPATPSSPSPTNSAALFQDQGLKATLPSDILFKDRESVLRPETQVILDTVASDLKSFPGSTIRVAAHTDDGGETKSNQDLSLRQAQAVQQYLARSLGEEQFHWVVLGYGASQPVVDNTTTLNRQRNRRIEISLDSRK